VESHEDGKVVLFCGAGISYPAGLPGFEGLTRRLFEDLGEDLNSTEKAAFEEKRFDVAIDLLERRIRNRPMVREKIQAILTPPNLGNPVSTNTHRSILTLGKSKDNSLRVVTTNFDRIFLEVDPSLIPYAAPLLPIPKKSRWNGLVHLHGLLPKANDPTALNNLVVSSGDFGLAYLTERWASRFVTELFRNYVVCFVGYSLGDPVLRYMLDALAADRILGEESDDVFAFAPFSEGREEEDKRDWQSKGVVPILYCEDGGHDPLHNTLFEWAGLYRDGMTGKRAIITHEANMPPSRNASDGQVDRVIWALMDPMAAKAFADLDPIPPVEWLDVFAEPRFKISDLSSLGVTQRSSIEDGKLFSLINRPAPQDHNPYMALVSIADSDFPAPRLDEVMWHIARWICRHLGQQKVLTWVIKSGCSLHPQLRELVTRELNADPPRISGPLALIWRLICAGLGTNMRNYSSMSLYRWCNQFKRFGWSVSLKRELSQMLRPLVGLREPLQWDAQWEDGEEDQGDHPRVKRARDYASWEISLRIGESPWEKLKEIKGCMDWPKLAIDSLSEFTTCLQEALDLMAELGDVSWQSDLSYIARPSISDHPQNNDFRDWTALIQLCRDSWLSTATAAPALAESELERWNLIKYPLFKRLVFHVATESPLINNTQGLKYLLQDSAWWLWSPETQRESLCLLIHLADRLDGSQRSELCTAILEGPPRAMYREGLEEEDWSGIVDRKVWLRLKIWGETGSETPDKAKERLAEISSRFPKWQLAPDDQDQFPYRMESGSGGSFRTHTALPRQLERLVDALRTRPVDDHWYEDDWENICRTAPDQAMAAIRTLGENGIWNAGVWRGALQVFAESEIGLTSLSEIGPYLLQVPKDTFSDLNHSYAWWLKRLARQVPSASQQLWFQLLDKIFEYADTDVEVSDGEAVSAAINNPVGQATEAILDFWYQTEPANGSELPEPVKSRLTRLFDPQPKGYVHGRVIMGAHLSSLYSGDPIWTTQMLLPYFNWASNPAETKGVWEGYLWTPRISAELLDAFKSSFLATARHYTDLGKHDSQYASILTAAALELGQHFTKTELREAFNALPKQGLAESAVMLARSLEGAEDRSEEYWSNRVKPLIESHWPKSHEKRSSHESTALVRICVHARSLFPEAVVFLMPFLRKTKNFGLPLSELAESGLATRYPREALSLLIATVDEDDPWPSEDLKNCLDQISSAESSLASDSGFRRLQEYWARYERSTGPN
jgi:hypothetical protein